ncbi:hypothetical protein E3A20_06930 [Planctomyces bekefii]|uniref:YD repeat-containing protein n=1 Tax=Planctomyces bekefii TaxID=1653850 RepID=A0A5C6M7X4_9PLAN|nr:hypothetical protein E3A20_06930 [Planctomyces bekefii]
MRALGCKDALTFSETFAFGKITVPVHYNSGGSVIGGVNFNGAVAGFGFFGSALVQTSPNNWVYVDGNDVIPLTMGTQNRVGAPNSSFLYSPEGTIRARFYQANFTNPDSSSTTTVAGWYSLDEGRGISTQFLPATCNGNCQSAFYSRETRFDHEQKSIFYTIDGASKGYIVLKDNVSGDVLESVSMDRSTDGRLITFSNGSQTLNIHLMDDMSGRADMITYGSMPGAKGLSTVFTYVESSSRIASMMVANGHMTYATYDSEGNLATTKNFLNYKTIYTRSSGMFQSVTVPGPPANILTFSGGRLTSFKQGNLNPVNLTFDANYKYITAVSRPDGAVTNFTMIVGAADVGVPLVGSVSGDFGSRVFAYDAGLTVPRTITETPNFQKTGMRPSKSEFVRESYYPNRLLSRIHSYNNIETKKTTFTYQAADKRDFSVTSYAYGHATYRLDYEDNNLVFETTLGQTPAQTKTYTYTADNHLASLVRGPSGKSNSLTYISFGGSKVPNLVTSSDGTSWAYQYSIYNGVFARESTVTDPNGWTLRRGQSVTQDPMAGTVASTSSTSLSGLGASTNEVIRYILSNSESGKIGFPGGRNVTGEDLTRSNMGQNNGFSASDDGVVMPWTVAD